MNPRLLEPYDKAEKLKDEKADTKLWMMGSYVFEAVSTSLANAFRKKGTQAKAYRDKPYTMIVKEEHQELSQDEIVEKTKILFRMLTIRQKNFELEKKFKNSNKPVAEEAQGL